MSAMFGKRLPFVPHVGLSCEVHHVVLLDALLGEVEPCVVLGGSCVCHCRGLLGASFHSPLTSLDIGWVFNLSGHGCDDLLRLTAT